MIERSAEQDQDNGVTAQEPRGRFSKMILRTSRSDYLCQMVMVKLKASG